ncbi:hypothetical protein DFH08DRAFT_789036 [Mycena albidolilacea]|uniref:DUF5648 domain-containing protein n=1 Tax=Mycena albidolilacea TaxID=1033008 RepID=A0AAD6ZF04_9AGAR|nr:hypothetical protein DFH08DRAFT_789036 [Mycena albidolilacea]
MKYLLPTILVLSTTVCFTSATLSSEPAPAEAQSAKTCGEPTTALPLYRMFQATVPARAYEIDASIITANIAKSGWALETVSAMAFASQKESTVPFYHLINSALRANFWTINTTERDAAVRAGYTVGPDLTYIYPTQICESVPFYHASGSANRDNVYTTSEAEYLQFVGQGFLDMGVAGYVLPFNAIQCA